MDKKLSKEIADLWNKQFADTTEATATIAKIEDKGETVVIYPARSNDGTCFFSMEEVTDICRTFQLNAYVSCLSGQCLARIY